MPFYTYWDPEVYDEEINKQINNLFENRIM